jgi:hypothetical protein
MKKILLVLLLVGCAGQGWKAPDDFVYVPIKTEHYEIATWQKINNPNNNNIHIYIEGDGNAFDAYGQPNGDPTPNGTFVRDLATRDSFENVVYMARPCQFIKTDSCNESDWTTGRFSQKIIDAESGAIKRIAGNKKITLIGYSGGAMVSGLVIEQNPKLKIEKWITVAGVLDHKKWTQYFGDADLSESLNMETLPKVQQIHFVGGRDEIVPYELAKTWANESDIKLIPNAKHSNFGDLKIFD